MPSGRYVRESEAVGRGDGVGPRAAYGWSVRSAGKVYVIVVVEMTFAGGS